MQRPIFLVYGVDIGPTVKGLLRRGYSVKVVEDANRSLMGMPLRMEDIVERKVNPYPDQIVGPLSEEIPLEFMTTKQVLAL
jgi:hypothetical protein